MELVKGLVIYTKPWDMTDETTGERRKGISVEYLMCEDLAPVENDDGSKGVRHCKESLNSDKANKIQAVPGYYSLKFGIRPGARGKVSIKLDDIDYLGPVIGG